MLNRRSIRFRITAVAAAAVAGVLILGGLGLVLLQRAALTASIDQTLVQRADDLTGLVQNGAELPAGADDCFAQVVSADGEALASTPNLVGEPALSLDVPPGSQDTFHTVTGLELDDDPFRVLTRHLPGVGTLHVGTTSELVAESTAALGGALLVTIPILVLALASVVWWLVGRTLQPVEDIRAGVAEIGSTDLHRRVPQPGTEDEIDRLAGTMNQMLERLESSVDRQRRFVADASHELRNPLTRMRAALEVDLANADQPSRASQESLLDDVVDMQRTADDLLYLARVDEGTVHTDFAPLDLDDLVLGEAQRIQAQARVDVDLSGVSGAHVVGDRGQLTRAIRNLLDNAERHAESGISVRLQESGDTAVLTVTDDGAGIAPENRELVFERFSRLDEARAADTGGAGLGLAIARDIAQRHGGSLSLGSSDGSGASFELALPLVDTTRGLGERQDS